MTQQSVFDKGNMARPSNQYSEWLQQQTGASDTSSTLMAPTDQLREEGVNMHLVCWLVVERPVAWQPQIRNTPPPPPSHQTSAPLLITSRSGFLNMKWGQNAEFQRFASMSAQSVATAGTKSFHAKATNIRQEENPSGNWSLALFDLGFVALH